MANLPLLLQLQTIDSRLQVLSRSREEARRHPNLEALQLLEQEMVAQQATQTAGQANARNALRRLELDLKTCLERLRIEEGKLYGGSISSGRELETLQQKIAELRKTQAGLEDQILAAMEQDEQLTQSLEAVQKRLVTTVKEAGDYRKEIERRLAEIAIENESLEQDRRELLERIPKDWLERYQRIAKSHHGLAIAKMKTNCCGACHVAVSEFWLQKAKRGDDAFVYCENCGRILFY